MALRRYLPFALLLAGRPRSCRVHRHTRMNSAPAGSLLSVTDVQSRRNLRRMSGLCRKSSTSLSRSSHGQASAMRTRRNRFSSSCVIQLRSRCSVCRRPASHRYRRIGRSDARVRAKLLKRLRKHGLTDQDVAALVEAWKRAADEHERLEGDAFALGGGRTAAPGPGRQME